MVECLPAQNHHFAKTDSHQAYGGLRADRHHLSEDEELEQALLASAALYQETNDARALAQKRLAEALELYRGRVCAVAADGNCQFRALSVALYGSEERHAEMRAQVVQQMRRCPQDYSPFVHEPFGEYLARMERDGEWGDNVTLQAASDKLSCRVKVFTDVPGSECVTVTPKQLMSTEGLVQQPLWSLPDSLCLTFLTEWHYDAAFLTKS